MTRNRISTSGALSAEVGSSMMRMRALRATALAISTSCCWPIIRSSTLARGSTAVCRRSISARGLALLLGVIDAPVAHDLAVGEDVFRDREVAEQVQLLEHHADAVGHRVGGVREDDRLAVEQDPSGRRPLDAGDHLHQGRLAGAVLADQHVDRAAAHLEIGLLHRDGARIDLRHPFEAQDDVLVGGRRRSLMASVRS